MKTMKHLSRSTALVLAMLAAAVFVAACGSSSSAGAAKPTASTSRTAFSACLKQHGVTLPSGAKGQFPGAGKGHFRAGGGRRPSGGFPGGGTGGAGAYGTPPTGGASGGFPGAGGATGAGARGAFGSSKLRTAMKDCAAKLGAGRAGFGGGARAGAGGGPGSGPVTPHFSTKTLDSFVSCIRTHGYAAMPEPKSGATSVFSKSLQSNPKFEKAYPKCVSILQKAFKASAGAPGSGASST